jgi:hypothetical protein
MDNKIISELDDLFMFAPPNELRKSINTVFYSYLIHADKLPHDYKKTSEDFYFLINFLERADELHKTKRKTAYNSKP